MDDFVARHLAGVSRTYALLIPMLPAALREPVGLAYLLMRIVDTLEDAGTLSDERRRRLLGQLQAVLADPAAAVSPELTAPIGDTSDERALMADSPAVFARLHRLPPVYRDAARHCATQMIHGVYEFLDRSAQRGRPYPAIQDVAELRSYCYYVAGVVGEMLCDMMAHYLDRPQLRGQRARAVELGTGLQLVNILKDAHQDARQGRRYLPAPTADTSADIYQAVLSEARRSLERGAEYVLALPAAAVELRSFCGLPIVWGALTLANAERDPRQAKISRADLAESTTRFQTCAADDAALRAWFDNLLRAPAVHNHA